MAVACRALGREGGMERGREEEKRREGRNKVGGVRDREKAAGLSLGQMQFVVDEFQLGL